MRSQGKSAELARWIEARRPERIGEAEFEMLRAHLAPVSDSYLRRLVRACGVSLSPLVEGVRQSTFDELEATLLRLLAEYQPGNAEQRREAGRLVITAKEHARLAARRPEKRAEKEEMVLWMNTWLENPSVFDAWVSIRRGLRAKDQPE